MVNGAGQGATTLEPVTIDIDGHIDLIDRESTDKTDESDRARQSRLADVMIVLEREHATLEQTLHERLASLPATNSINGLTLELDATAPNFHVAMRASASDDAAAPGITPEQCAVLEVEIAGEVRALIEQRAAHSPTQRWQPVVTATCRNPAVSDTTATARSRTVSDASAPADDPAASATRLSPEAARQRRLKSIWLYMLFWLLALVVLGAAYLAIDAYH